MNSLYTNKKILVFGLGLNKGGVGSTRFFAKNGAKVRVTDLKSEKDLQSSLDKLKEFKNISYTLGEHKFEDIDWADLIIKNPAVKPGNKYIEYALKKGKEVEMEMGIFLKYVNPQQIIGVTGTKGKSTTASLIYAALKKSLGVKLAHTRGGIGTHRFKNIILAGNIGKSVLEVIPQIKEATLIVLEISSFQLESFEVHQVSPKWALITNITPDHLNYYQTMDEYIQAKKVIAKYQTKDDFLFIRKDDQVVDRPDFLQDLKAHIVRFSKNDLPTDFQPHLPGEHNLENMAAAYSVGKALGVNSNLLLKSLTQFKGVPLRMELIKEWNGIRIYNDTTATSPEAGIQAIKTLSNLASHSSSGNVVLICGGMNKKMDYTEYVSVVSQYTKRVFFLEGDSSEKIKDQISKIKNDTGKTYDNLEELLKDVKKVAKPGDIVLFSPAATSFNLFQNEFDRGEKFNRAVEKVFQ